MIVQIAYTYTVSRDVPLSFQFCLTKDTLLRFDKRYSFTVCKVEEREKK